MSGPLSPDPGHRKLLRLEVRNAETPIERKPPWIILELRLLVPTPLARTRRAQASAGNHFGERAASIAGSVFVDFSPALPANTNNGVRDAGETGIANVPVTLTGRDINGNTVTRSTTTARSRACGCSLCTCAAEFR